MNYKKLIKTSEISPGKDFATSDSIKRRELAIYFTPIIEKYLKLPKRHLDLVDIGGGSGIVGLTVKKYLDDIVNEVSLDIVDINPEMLKGVNYEANLLGYDSLNNIKTICKNVLNENNNKKYDVVLMRYVLNYLDKKDNLKMLSKVKNYVKEKGIFIHNFLYSYSEQIYNFWKELYKITDESLNVNRKRIFLPYEKQINNHKLIFDNCNVEKKFNTEMKLSDWLKRFKLKNNEKVKSSLINLCEDNLNYSFIKKNKDDYIFDNPNAIVVCYNKEK